MQGSQVFSNILHFQPLFSSDPTLSDLHELPSASACPLAPSTFSPRQLTKLDIQSLAVCPPFWRLTSIRLPLSLTMYILSQLQTPRIKASKMYGRLVDYSVTSDYCRSLWPTRDVYNRDWCKHSASIFPVMFVRHCVIGGHSSHPRTPLLSIAVNPQSSIKQHLNPIIVRH